MVAEILHAFGTEGPREIFIGAVVGVFVTVALGWFSHRLHQLREAAAQQRHEESMEAHDKVHKHLGLDE